MLQYNTPNHQSLSSASSSIQVLPQSSTMDLEQGVDFCQSHSWIFSCKMTDVFLDTPWSRCPPSWIAVFMGLKFEGKACMTLACAGRYLLPQYRSPSFPFLLLPLSTSHFYPSLFLLWPTCSYFRVTWAFLELKDLVCGKIDTSWPDSLKKFCLLAESLSRRHDDVHSQCLELPQDMQVSLEFTPISNATRIIRGSGQAYFR